MQLRSFKSYLQFVGKSNITFQYEGIYYNLMIKMSLKSYSFILIYIGVLQAALSVVFHHYTHPVFFSLQQPQDFHWWTPSFPFCKYSPRLACRLVNAVQNVLGAFLALLPISLYLLSLNRFYSGQHSYAGVPLQSSQRVCASALLCVRKCHSEFCYFRFSKKSNVFYFELRNNQQIN